MKIAFASCAKIQKFPIQPAWKSIEDENPDLLLLLGDTIYSPNNRWDHVAMEELYKEQFCEPNFSSLIKKVPFKAIWDDHDFGPNNSKGGEVDHVLRERSRKLFHKHMKSSTNLPEAYYSFVKDNIRFVMLDVRYYRESHRRKNASPLGGKQMNWLKHELSRPEKFKILCSGTCLKKMQLLQDEYLSKYKQFYRKEFLPLLQKTNNLIVLTGDIHRNAFVPRSSFFEIISSAVGRDIVGGNNNRNNYGLLEFSGSKINISLKGRRKPDKIEKVIDVPSWKLIEQSE